MNILFKNILYCTLAFCLLATTYAFGQQTKNSVLATEKIQMGQFTEAMELLKDAKSEKDLALLIEVYVKTGEINSAQSLIKTLKDITTKKLMQALVIQYLGKYEEALDTLSQINPYNIKDMHLRYNVIKTLGINNWLSGNYNLAEYWLKDYHQNYATTNGYTAQSSNNLGLVYLQNDPNLAVSFFTEGLSHIGTETSLIKISLNNNLALAYKLLGKSPESIETFEKSLQYLGNQFANTPIHAYILNNISQLYFEKNEVLRAIETAEKANNILSSYYHGVHPEIAASHNVLAGYFLAQQKYGMAQEHILKAYEKNSESLAKPNHPLLCKRYTGVINKRLFIETMILEAESYETKYYHKNPKLSFLKKALNIYTLADSLVYEIRKNTKLETDKIALNKATTKLYDNAIMTALKISELGFHKQRYFEIAYLFSEKSKSSVLLDAINDSKSKKFANIPDSVLKQETDLKSMISYYELNKAQIPSAPKELIALYQKNATLLKTLESQYPKYYELKYQHVDLKVGQIQERLNAGQIVLNYHIADSKASIICFVVHKHKTEAIINTKDELFEKRLISLRNAISINDSKIFIRSVNYLNERLLNFKIPKGKHLIIIPDPKLGNTPFEVLTKAKIKKDTISFFRINYLLNDHPVSYYYSNRLLLLHDENTTSYTPSALLCSPVNYKGGLASLPGAALEINTADSILRSQGHKTEKVLQAQATESNIKKLLISPYKYIMISSHGIVNEMNPDRSQIFLNDGDNEDGDLFAGEIYNMKIKTMLLLLPCCQTGLGKVIKGEGVMGLSRALIYAGAENMMLSLWNVSDTHSQEISSNLFTNLTQKGMDPATSLQLSKKKLLKKKESANPYLWAPYILIGK